MANQYTKKKEREATKAAAAYKKTDKNNTEHARKEHPDDVAKDCNAPRPRIYGEAKKDGPLPPRLYALSAEDSRRVADAMIKDALTRAASRAEPRRETSYVPGGDEPILVLKARDNIAPQVIDAWIKIATDNGVPPYKVAGVQNIARAVKDWRAANPLKCKMPS